MKAVVLARGLGRRMRADDDAAPLDPAQQEAASAGLKAMMPVGMASGSERLFLDYVLDALADAGCDDVAVVVAPDHDAIRRHYEGERPPERVTLTLLVQAEPLGTADAVLACAAWSGDEPFLVVNADNLYPTEVLRELVALDEPGLPVFRRDELLRSSNIPAERVAAFALVDVDDAGYLTGIAEKPGPGAMASAGSGALVSMNCWRFDRRIYGACRDVPLSPRGELELPEAVGVALDRGVPFAAVPARGPVLDLSKRSDVVEVTRRLSGREPRP